MKYKKKQSYNFINKLTRYTQGHFKFRIIWQTIKKNRFSVLTKRQDYSPF